IPDINSTTTEPVTDPSTGEIPASSTVTTTTIVTDPITTEDPDSSTTKIEEHMSERPPLCNNGNTGPISVTLNAKCCATNLCNGPPPTTTSAASTESITTVIPVTTFPIIEVTMILPEPIETIPIINETNYENVTVPETTTFSPVEITMIIHKPIETIPFINETNYENVTVPETTTFSPIEITMIIPKPIETTPVVNETISVNVTVPETNLTTTPLTLKKNATIIKPAPEIPPLTILAPKTNHTNVTLAETNPETVTDPSTPSMEAESTTQEADSTAGSSSLNTGSGLLMILLIVASPCR
ncbi:hypothetical protein PRIPAC_89191, partial [Pristionchus pacificus]|uniref:Uncharacterized protein n=1 Tax=Pristionchus pacificus TaxID=54126 RepID=A0A2A6B5L9_PRIPA